MDDAAQGKGQGGDLGKGALHVGFLRRVALQDEDVNTALLQGAQGLTGCRGRLAAPKERQAARALIGQPPGGEQAQAAQAAGDQIGSVRADNRRHTDDNFAYLSRLLHITKGRNASCGRDALPCFPLSTFHFPLLVEGRHW